MSMQAIEPFGGHEEDWQPTTHSVTLKEGIDLTELQRGAGVQFEVDLSAPLPGGGGRRREEGSPDGRGDGQRESSPAAERGLHGTGVGGRD
ncbi:hypothetical protein GBAR_LOCUS9501 [Geodia barretti]|uniref:Uncharacterized protein n=1 Tax=Geodia barretti TaxID=519541 RepID=A0AA35RPG8_GEOBA|nr:hypothetical protein GBAR_LOCUS9501 [Geodia barretti]